MFLLVSGYLVRLYIILYDIMNIDYMRLILSI